MSYHRHRAGSLTLGRPAPTARLRKGVFVLLFPLIAAGAAFLYFRFVLNTPVPPTRLAVAYAAQPNGIFAAIDAEGYVVFTTPFAGTGRPIVYGLYIMYAEPHNPLTVHNTAHLAVALLYLAALREFGLEEWVTRLDVTDLTALSLRLFHFEVWPDGRKDAGEQARFLAGLVADWPEVRVRTGVLDLREAGGRYVFR